MLQLNVKNISYAYGKSNVLDDLSISIMPGEIVGLLGVNGAGKSTLFKLIAGLYFLQQGEIYFTDRLVAKANKSVSAFMRSNMGVVFQDCSLDDKLTAEANLLLSGRVYGVPKKVLVQRISSGIEEFNLAKVLHHKVKTFSGGMKRRLELLRALLHEPQFLLMDEPTSGLDPEGFERFWHHISLNKKQKEVTTLIATHKIEEAERCDRLLILHNGKLVADKSPIELRNMVSGDRVCLRFTGKVDKLCKHNYFKILQQKFEDLIVSESENEIVLIAQDGHCLVPRVVETLPPNVVQSVYVRKPTLADAFLKVTGSSL